MVEIINRRLLLLELIALSIIILSGAGQVQPAELKENRLAQEELAQKYLEENNEPTIYFFIKPNDKCWHEPQSISIKQAENIPKGMTDGRLNSALVGVSFHNWRGFALNDNESHTVRISIESVRPIDAMNVRRLLSSNMTIEEISEEIGKDGGDAIYRGVLRIREDIYKMDNILMTPAGNRTVLDANISELKFGPSQNNVSTNIGHLNVTVAEDEMEIGQGILSFESGKYCGKYRVLLDAQTPGRETMGQGPGHMMPI
jgi:hypothetical protein